MLSERQMQGAMDEWLTVDGLTEPEINLITELRNVAAKGEAQFRSACTFFAQVMPEVVISAAWKARDQGKMQCWPT